MTRLTCDAGHGIGSTKSHSFGLVADAVAFALWQMGVPGYLPRP